MENVTKLSLVDTYKNEAVKIIDSLDVSVGTRTDYKYRIGLFLKFISDSEFTYNSFLEFKRYLEQRRDYSTATKNKYLATAKIFLKELNRRGVLPSDFTQNIKSFKQNKKHKRDGLSEDEVKTVLLKLEELDATIQSVRLQG